MMLIKLFLFFLLLLILPDMYIYKAYIRRVYQKWTHWAYWLPSLFLLLGMTLVFSIHEPRPDSMQRLSNFLLIFLCFSVPKALFVIVILFMKLLYIISGKKTVWRICSRRIGFSLVNICNIWSNRRKTAFSNQGGNHQFR